jgi:hypothetical protein
MMGKAGAYLAWLSCGRKDAHSSRTDDRELTGSEATALPSPHTV